MSNKIIVLLSACLISPIAIAQCCEKDCCENYNVVYEPCRNHPKADECHCINPGYYSKCPETTAQKFKKACCPINPCYEQKHRYLNCPGFYARIAGGASFMNNLNTNLVSGNSVIGNTTTLYNGFDGEVAAGYRFLSNFRTELQYGYIYNQMMRNKSGSVNNDLYYGAVNANTVFLNGYYHMHINSLFEPYLGVGIGYIWSHDEWQLTNSAPTNTYRTWPNSMGYQAIGGVGYQLSRQVSIGLEYKYLYAQMGTYTVKNASTDPSTQTSGKYQFNMSTNLVNLTVAYQFGM